MAALSMVMLLHSVLCF